jgi:hypothetical protein
MRLQQLWYLYLQTNCDTIVGTFEEIHLLGGQKMIRSRNERSGWFVARKQRLAHDRDIRRIYRECPQITTGWFEFGVDFVQKLDFYTAEFFDSDPYRHVTLMEFFIRDLEEERKKGTKSVLAWVDSFFPEMIAGASESGRLRFAEAVSAPG